MSVGSGSDAVLTLTKTGARTVWPMAVGNRLWRDDDSELPVAWGDVSTTTVPPIASAPHVYAADATYTVRLTVIDSLGRGDSTQTVTFP